MNIVFADLETYYSADYSLSKMTTEAYVRDPRFEVIGMCVKHGDGDTVWVDQPDVAAYLQSVDWSDTMVVAQNTMFDAAILAWHYGVKPKAWGDTLGMSRALYPHEKSHALAAQAARLGLGAKGDEVVRAMGKRRRDFTPAEIAAYARYCANDVELTYQLFQNYIAQGFPVSEMRLIDLTLRMFVEPVLQLDATMLTDHLEAVRERKQAHLDAVRRMVDDPEGDVRKVLMSNDRFAALLESFGVEPPTKISPTTGRITWAFAKTDEAFKALEEHHDERVQALVSARLGTKSTIEETRTETLLDYAMRGEFPIALRYYGAHTGRWSAESSAKVNMQNLPRTSPIKRAIKPPPGQIMCGADLSNIELRLGLWLSGQGDKLQALADGLDLYKDFAAKVFNAAYDDVTKHQRQVGKVSNLSLIYGTGPAKLREALRIMGGVKMDLEEVKPIVSLYRSVHYAVVSAWEQGEQTLQAIATDQEMPYLKDGICRVEGRRGIRLPNGLHLQFPNLRKEFTDKGKPAWVFDSKYGPEKIYGSKIFQGCTQAIARCVMADGIRRLGRTVAPVVLTIHDSAYWLAPKGREQDYLDRGIACITHPVPYCPGLPLAAEGSFGDSLADC